MQKHDQTIDDELTNVVEIWKTIIDVQKHFNEIGMRIRSAFITILLALFASIGFLLDKNLRIEFESINIQLAIVIPIFGILGTYLFYFIDRYWYHRPLMGAVKQGVEVENRYKDRVPSIGLTTKIGIESPYTPTGVSRWLAFLLVRHGAFRKTGNLHSEGKIELFYKSVVLAFVVVMVILAIFGGISFRAQKEDGRNTPKSGIENEIFQGVGSTPY